MLALLCAAGIFILSSASFNSSETLQVLRRILGLFHLSLAPATIDLLNGVIRKLAHLTEYAIFSVLVYRCFGAAQLPGWHPRPALWALIIAGVYSLTDEFHQSFVPGRTAAWTDCGIDTAGAALGIFALYFRERLSAGSREFRI